MKTLMEVTKMSRFTTICISLIVVSLMFAGQSYAKVDPATVLGTWLLDEGTGNITGDASGNNNDGTLLGAPAWIAGQSGSALQFNGSSSYVNCGNAEALNVNVFSVSFWYNFPATQSWNHMISRGQHAASGAPGSVNWGLMMYSAEQRILYETYENTSWRSISANTTAGQWHHVVATYDVDTMQLYHDGQLAGTSGADMRLDPTRRFLIGARSDAGSAGGFFNGSIDEVGYFNAVLTPEDVQAIMNDGLAAIARASNLLARRPDPKDGAPVAQTWLTISWTAGDSAVSHDMYLGESFEDVNAGTGNTFRGNLTSPLFPVGLGMPGDPYPAGLVPGTTYYWRVDEVEADASTKHKGPVWSFWISPKKAYNPVPPSGTKYVATDVALSWTAGLGAKLHYVYFGDNFDTVSNATGGSPVMTPGFTPPGPLAKGKTYYWRVDEFDGGATHKGNVWSFTTLTSVPVTDPNLVAWYKFEAGAGTKVLDFSGHENHGTIVPGPRGTVQWVEGLFNMALEFLGDSQGYVEMPPTIVTTAKGSILMWINTTQGDAANNDEGMLWWACQIANGDGYGGENEIHINIDDPGNGELDFFLEEDGAGNDITIDGPEVGGTGWRHVAATWDLAEGCRLYVDGVEVGYAAHNTNVKSFAAMRLGRPVSTGSGNCFYDGLMDDVRLFDYAISAAKVAEIVSKGEDPLRAGALNPSSGALTPINQATPLSWSPGEKASQHDVYFGADRDAVVNTDTSDTTGIYRGRQSATSYTPPEGVQMAGGPYYWRIDEVSTDGTITTGAVWSFSVADYVLVEDFESYNDIPAGQAGSNLVYVAWLDGYGTTTNGSTMGYP
ncbi:MAG TPA: LamG domain-containing protein, partial [Sedimentisphaerales bacterium]|nr:LamG domain-containing protein [Sedimentisphaerales bacterium]